ncbi:hypothetical protein EMPS_06694 [Entomortierella parvispora]|uniref:NmrA-like domain-containing protein n=1 Tax=Entomortierella parvispora TaxID=205924 RepID=A0A9P3LXH2_9FUNG|nr:hypothetical protein EMPS_06694 [Entomortierella parvispora]
MTRNNYIEKVAIVGAGGNLGKHLTASLLATGKHSVTAITRHDSANVPIAGVAIAKVDYSKQETLIEALKGHDALIITMSVTAPPETQTQIIDAAAAAGIPWIMPNEWGSDNDQKEYQRDTYLGAGQEKVRNYIDAKGCFNRLVLTCNFWYEHSLCSSPVMFGFDAEKRQATFYGDGTVKINTSTWNQCGRAVSALFSLPIQPENENDKSLTLQQFKNKSAYISSFFVSQKDMFASLLRVTGTTEKDWTISYEDPKQRYAEGQKEFASGNRAGFGKLLYARMFYPEGCGDYEAKLNNDLLGLPKEDLDEATKRAIELAQSGYMYTRP